MIEFLKTLETRFTFNTHRHPSVKWSEVANILSTNPEFLDIIIKMEETGGEIDILFYKDALYVVDFSTESPKGRRSLCYDETARNARKANKPVSSVEAVAKTIGISIVDEEMYQYMQDIEDFDLKTSSWIKTPPTLRSLGGALNAEKRYQRTFIFHNGADSYYASRGFRGYLKIT